MYIDTFGKPINFTYKGNYTYKTSTGGIITIIMYTIMTALTAWMLSNVLTSKIISVSREFVHYDRINSLPFNLSSYNFKIQVGFS